MILDYVVYNAVNAIIASRIADQHGRYSNWDLASELVKLADSRFFSFFLLLLLLLFLPRNDGKSQRTGVS